MSSPTEENKERLNSALEILQKELSAQINQSNQFQKIVWLLLQRLPDKQMELTQTTTLPTGWGLKREVSADGQALVITADVREPPPEKALLEMAVSLLGTQKSIAHEMTSHGLGNYPPREVAEYLYRFAMWDGQFWVVPPEPTESPA